MSEARPEITCPTCPTRKKAACCRILTVIQLTEPERDFLEGHGAALKPHDEDDLPGLHFFGSAATKAFFENPPLGKHTYMFMGDCPFLVQVEGLDWPQCGIYTDSRRPGACSHLQEDSAGCHSAIDLQATLDNMRD